MHKYLKPNSDEVASKIVDGEAILINLLNGMYYSMDSVGGFIWSLIEAGHSQESIAEAVADHYGIARKTAIQDVATLIGELTEENLIVSVTGEAVAGSHEIDDTSAPEAYTAPRVNKFDDMVDLFALDPPLPELSNLRSPSKVDA